MTEVSIDVKAIVAKHRGEWKAVFKHTQEEFLYLSRHLSPQIQKAEATRIYTEMLTAIREWNENEMNNTHNLGGSAALVPSPKVVQIPGFNPKD